jgi:hypothetical protein
MAGDIRVAPSSEPSIPADPKDEYRRGWNDAIKAAGESDFDQLIKRIAELEGALRLYAKYAPRSGAMALLIRASQAGGQEAAEYADAMILHYSRLDDANDLARAALAAPSGVKP